MEAKLIVYRGFDVPSRTSGGGRAAVWIDESKQDAARGPFDLPNLVTGKPGGLDWGSTEHSGIKVPRRGCDALALALCAAVLEEPEARRVHKLFQHRHINDLPAGRWTFTHSQVRAWVQAIQQDLVANARAVARAPQERPQIERDTGPGANGLPVRWDSDDEGQIIPATDPDDMTWSPAPYRRGA